MCRPQGLFRLIVAVAQLLQLLWQMLQLLQLLLLQPWRLLRLDVGGAHGLALSRLVLGRKLRQADLLAEEQ